MCKLFSLRRDGKEPDFSSETCVTKVFPFEARERTNALYTLQVLVPEGFEHSQVFVGWLGEGPMRHLLSCPALLLLLNVFPSMATGQTGATTTLIASPTTITVGSSVGLAATVQPNAAPVAGKTVPRPSGTITFLDGSTSLSSAPIALAPNGIASATFPQTFGTPDSSLTAGEGVGDLNGDGVQDLLIYGYATPLPLQTFTSNGKGGYNASAVQTFSFSSWVRSAAHRFQRGRKARSSMRSSGRLWKWGWDLRPGGSCFVSFQRIQYRIRLHSLS